MPARILTLYVAMLSRVRTLRRLDSTVGVDAAASCLREVDDTLALSPRLVGGVNDSDASIGSENSEDVMEGDTRGGRSSGS